MKLSTEFSFWERFCGGWFVFWQPFSEYFLVSVSFCGDEMTSTGYSSSTVSTVVCRDSASFSLLLNTLVCKYPASLWTPCHRSWLWAQVKLIIQYDPLFFLESLTSRFGSPSCKCDLCSVFLDIWPCIWLNWDACLEESQLTDIGLLCVTCLSFL